MLRGRGHVFPAALAVTVGSVIGCVIAYLAGAFAFDLFASSVTAVASAGALDGARAAVAERGAWAVFFGMMTPVPVQITSLAAGLGGVGFATFLAAATAGRTVRYLSMAVLVFAYGGAILRWWRKRSSGVKALAIAAFLAAFVAALWLSISG
jgi:membrane protein YqaA with SNARE-associated domain